MTRNRFAIFLGVALASLSLAGCRQKSNARNTASAQTTPSGLQLALTDWQQGNKTSAVSNFVAANWSNAPAFPQSSLLSLSEAEFQSQVKSFVPSAQTKNVEKAQAEIIVEVDGLKKLVAAVTQSGREAAAKNDEADARKHFEAVRQCALTLDSTNSLAILRLVAQGMKKSADAELLKLKTP